MVLTGTNTASVSNTVAFTLTIVRDCSSATVVAPSSITDKTYKINESTKT